MKSLVVGDRFHSHERNGNKQGIDVEAKTTLGKVRFRLAEQRTHECG